MKVSVANPLGLSDTSISDPLRRDRLLFINALAVMILTLLGAAGEQCVMDKYIKVNTAKRRQLSLFRQGCHYFNRLIRMKFEEAENFINVLTIFCLNERICRKFCGLFN